MSLLDDQERGRKSDDFICTYSYLVVFEDDKWWPGGVARVSGRTDFPTFGTGKRQAQPTSLTRQHILSRERLSGHLNFGADSALASKTRL